MARRSSGGAARSRAAWLFAHGRLARDRAWHLALRLARDGAHCVITYRRQADAAHEVVEAVERLGVKGLALPLELADPSAAAPFMDQVGEAFGRLDVLVASAAATAFRRMLEQKAHNVRLTFAITVESYIALVQAAVPLMRGRPGRVVAISGIDSFQAMTGHGILGSAKAAMESLVRAFALELGPEGITVNGVNPWLHRDGLLAPVRRAGARQRKLLSIPRASTSSLNRVSLVRQRVVTEDGPRRRSSP